MSATVRWVSRRSTGSLIRSWVDATAWNSCDRGAARSAHTVGMARGLFRSGGVAIALATLSCLAGCFAQQGAPPPDAASEDELRFRASNVDKSLPDVDAIGYEIDLRVNDVPGPRDVRGRREGLVRRDARPHGAHARLRRQRRSTTSSSAAAPRPTGAKARSSIIKLPQPVASGPHVHVARSLPRHRRPGRRRQPERLRRVRRLQREAAQRRAQAHLLEPQLAEQGATLAAAPRSPERRRDGRDEPARSRSRSPSSRTASRSRAPRTPTARARGATRRSRRCPPTTFTSSPTRAGRSRTRARASGIPITTYTYANAARSQHAVYGDLPKALDFYESKFGKYRWGTRELHRGADLRRRHGARVGRQHGRDALPRPGRGAQDGVPRARAPLERQPRAHPHVERLLAERGLHRVPHRALPLRERRPRGEEDGLPRVPHRRRSRPIAATRIRVRPADPEIDVLTIFDAISYQKGALVLHALERVVGEEKLTEFLKGWFDRHAFGAGHDRRSPEGALRRVRQGSVEVLRGLRLSAGTTPRSA